MYVLVVIGMPASGKGEVVEFFREKDFHVVSLGDAVRREAAIRGLKPTAENIGTLANTGREEHGDVVWAERVIEHIERSGILDQHECLLIDGVRAPEELELLRSGLRGELRVLAVHSSPKTRRRRVLSRGRSDDSRELAVFLERDERELGYGLGELISLSNYMVPNEGTLSELREYLFEAYENLKEMWKEDHGL